MLRKSEKGVLLETMFKHKMLRILNLRCLRQSEMSDTYSFQSTSRQRIPDE